MLFLEVVEWLFVFSLPLDSLAIVSYFSALLVQIINGKIVYQYWSFSFVQTSQTSAVLSGMTADMLIVMLP